MKSRHSQHLMLAIALIGLATPIMAGLPDPGTGDIFGLTVRTGTTTIAPIKIDAPTAGTVLKFSGNPASPITAGALTFADIGGNTTIATTTGLQDALDAKLAIEDFLPIQIDLQGQIDAEVLARTNAINGLGSLAQASSVVEGHFNLIDVTTANATTARHGLLPKLGGGTTNYLRADGTWAAPATFDATAALTLSANGALSTPPLKLSGTWLVTGGTATTTKPQFLVEPSGTTSTAWSTAGTGIGLNSPSGFSGHFLQCLNNNSPVFKLEADGAISAAGNGYWITTGTTATQVGVINQYNIRLNKDISIKWSSNSAYGGATSVQLLPTTTGILEVTDGIGNYRDVRLRCIKPDATNTAGGTVGAQTINKSAGSVNFAAGATSLVVTNSLVTAASNVICSINTNDATAVLKNVVAGSGSFTITLSAAATGETRVSFFVLN